MIRSAAIVCCMKRNITRGGKYYFVVNMFVICRLEEVATDCLSGLEFLSQESTCTSTFKCNNLIVQQV